MLEFQRGEAALLGPAQAREGDDGPDIRSPDAQLRTFGGGVEWTRLDTNSDRARNLAHGAIQPPVMGGKKAISRAPAIAVSGFTCLRSIAARTTRGFSKA